MDTFNDTLQNFPAVFVKTTLHIFEALELSSSLHFNTQHETAGF